jgi:hypothetical protein
MGLIYIAYCVLRLTETIKIINNGINFAAGDWPGHLHALVAEQGYTSLDINTLRKPQGSKTLTNIVAGNRTRITDMRYFESPVLNTILKQLNTFRTLALKLTVVSILPSHLNVGL